jgi:hypothetical protein
VTLAAFEQRAREGRVHTRTNRDLAAVLALIEAARTLAYVRDHIIDDTPEMWRMVDDALEAVGHDG